VKLCILRYSLVRRIGKFIVFVELFVVFGYEEYGREAGAVLICLQEVPSCYLILLSKLFFKSVF
jgi:hypothetical protein